MKYIFRFLIITTLFSGLSASAYASIDRSKALISDSIDILHYDIHLQMVHLSTHSIAGYTEMQVVARVSPLDVFRLYLQQLNVDSVLINGAAVASSSYNDTLISIHPLTPFSINDTFTLRIYYHGLPVIDPSSWGGFYFSSDSNFAYNLGVGFESVPHNYGRVWFPCIDDFIDRALYDYYITTKDDRMAVCGGTLMSGTDNGDGTKTWHWQMIHSIPTYLASVAVGPYVAVTDTYHGSLGDIPIFLYVRTGDTTNARNSFVNLNDILASFDSRFGPYRFERVGYVGVPFNSGAMEHATNIAYPLACFTGTTAYDDLYAHELSHMWFGDLVTCATAEDMWINEGWARYCEAIYRESLYGRTNYNSYMQSLHKDVVQFCHIVDDAYRAVYGIPAEYTYGSTVYDKGADVAHTLRGYLGDSLFFAALQNYMVDYAFNDISSTEFCDYLSTQTGIDLHPFFDAWIFAPGFPHFSIDSFSVSGTGPASVTVWVRQRLDHAPAFANQNILQLGFIDGNWNQYVDTLHFSGEFGQKTFTVPFVPERVLLDPNDLVADAITSHTAIVKSTGILNFPTTYCILDVTSISDSALVRVEHNFVPPDPMKIADPDIDRLSDYRYWKVDGIFPAGFVTKGKFRYNRTTSISTGYLDNTFMTTTSSKDSLRLLYRSGPADDWQNIPFTLAGTYTSGDLIVDTLKRGEYAMAIGKPVLGIAKNRGADEYGLRVYPNPSDSEFTIEWTYRDIQKIRIFNYRGNLVAEINVPSQEQHIVWEPGNRASGLYLLKIYDNKNTILGQEKVLYTR